MLIFWSCCDLFAYAICATEIGRFKFFRQINSIYENERSNVYYIYVHVIQVSKNEYENDSL